MMKIQILKYLFHLCLFYDIIINKCAFLLYFLRRANKMKKSFIKIFAAILISAILFSTFSLVVFANETSESDVNTSVSDSKTDSEYAPLKNALEFSCYYDTQTNKINVQGTMNYDSFAGHANSTLLIYSIPPGKTENEIINDQSITPIAQAPASITFAFSFKANTIIDRYSKYAIFLKSPDGTLTLTTEAQYAEIRTSNNEKNKDNFKGISGKYSSDISSTNPGTVVIPVYLDAIAESSSDGYIYQIEDKQYLFNKSYIDDLDSQIRSLSFFGATVYLQFLMRPNSIFKTNSYEEATYVLPNSFDTENITLLHSLTHFIASRYNNTLYGQINGIILGKSWDNPTQYNSYISTESDYINNCAQYISIISNSARSVMPSVEIFLPISANSFMLNSESSQTTESALPLKSFLPSLLSTLDASTYIGLNFSLHVESDTTPLDITNSNIDSGIDPNKELNNNKFYIGRHSELSEYIFTLSQEYKSLSKYYSVSWIPENTLNGNAICAAYTYAFYALLLDKNITNFIIDTSYSTTENNFLKDLSYILKHIDTKNSISATKNLLPLFNTDDWLNIFKTPFPSLNTKDYYTSDVTYEIPKNIKGEFCYFNFSQAFLADSWVKGIGCTNIKVDYARTSEKAFKGDFLLDKDFGEIIYTYDYPENISYTPYLKIKFEISSEVKDSLYELRSIFNTSTTLLETKTIVKGNDLNEIIIDISNIQGFSSLESVKFMIRSLDNAVDNCSLWIYDITGYSTVYSNDELQKFIAENRDKIKNDTHEKTTKEKIETLIFILVIILVTAFFGFALVFIIQRNHKRKKE